MKNSSIKKKNFFFSTALQPKPKLFVQKKNKNVSINNKKNI